MANSPIKRSNRRTKNSSSSSRSRVTRSQLEQQQKLRALYAESSTLNSENNNPASEGEGEGGEGVLVHSTKENVHNNSFMTPNLLSMEMDSREDDSKTGEGGGATGENNNEVVKKEKSAVTPSPRPDKSLSPTPRSKAANLNVATENVVEEAPPPPPPATEEELKARAARRANWPRKNITEPGPNDCLFGRGGGTNHHPGNKLYRKKVEDKKGKYLKSKRLDKPLVAMEIINEWRALDPPGRFLKQDDHTKMWNDVGDKKAREKTSQALREKTPVKQREDGVDPRGGGGGVGGVGGLDVRTTRFEPGTSSPVGRHVRKGSLAREHSLGETVYGHNEITLEGFSWDDSDRPVVRNADANVSPRAREEQQRRSREHEQRGYDPRQGDPRYPAEQRYPREQYHGEYHGSGEHNPPPQYGYHREHSLSNNPLSDASTAHPAPAAFGKPQHPPPDPYYGHHYPGYGAPPPPPPPPGHERAPPPPYHHPSHYPSPTASGPHHPQQHPAYSQYPPEHRQQQQPQQRSREHSLQMNPLKGASTSQPAREMFTDEESHASYDSRPPPLPSPRYEGGGLPPPLPSPYYGGYGGQSPQHGWPTPPGTSPHHPPGGSPHHPSPPPQFTYHPGSNPSAFGRYNSGDRSNSLRSLGSSVDAYYDARSSKVRSPSQHASSTSSAPKARSSNADNAASAGSSQDYSKIAELIRDSSDKSSSVGVERSNSWNDSGEKGYEDVVPRSKSLPYEESANDNVVVANPRVVTNEVDDPSMPPPTAIITGVQKPSLRRKLSGGGMHRNAPQPPPAGILRPAPVNGTGCRPEPVKRDTSNQPENMETKRSIKRVVLSRDQSAVSRRLKEEQYGSQVQKMRPGMATRVSSRMSKAEMLDRQMSVELNRLGLDDNSSSSGVGHSLLNRMTTDDVLASLIDDEELLSPSPTYDGPSNGSLSDVLPPKPIGEGDRIPTIDAIAMDMANGNNPEENVDNWDATLDLVVEEPMSPPPDLPHADSGGLNADIAEKWLKGET